MDLEEKRNVLRKWISDAVADGWSLQPTYGPDEPVEFAGTLTRAPAEDECVDAQHRTTWVVSYLDRPGKHAFDVSISAWAPDRLSVVADGGLPSKPNAKPRSEDRKRRARAIGDARTKWIGVGEGFAEGTTAVLTDEGRAYLADWPQPVRARETSSDGAKGAKG